MAQDAQQNQAPEPTPTPMFHIVLDKDNRIIHRHDVKHHGAYTDGMYQHLLDEHPGSTIRSFVNSPAHQIGHVLNTAGTEATRHTNDVPFDTVTSRWETIRDFALEEIPKSYHNTIHPVLYNRVSAALFSHFWYNLLLTAHNPVNRRNNDHWNLIKGSMISHKDFGAYINDSTLAQYRRVTTPFYSHQNVYLWLPSERHTLYLVRSTSLTADTSKVTDAHIPQYGLVQSQRVIRELLNIRHPHVETVALLSGISVMVGDNDAQSLSPVFKPDVMQYGVHLATNTVTAVTVTATTQHSGARAVVTGPETLVTGANEFRITVTSQDGENTEVYIVNVYKPV